MNSKDKVPEEITPWTVYEFFSLEELKFRVINEEDNLKVFHSKMRDLEN